VSAIDYFIFRCDGGTWSDIEVMNVKCFTKLEYRHTKCYVEWSVASVAAELESLTNFTAAASVKHLP